jgi:integrase
VKFTERTVAALELPEGRSEIIFFDTAQPGFGLRLRAGGSRTWIYQFKVGTQHRRISLGRVGVVSLQKAKVMAADMAAMVRLGRDPVAEKHARRVRAAETFGNACKPFLVRQARRLRDRTYAETERYLLVHLKPLHGLQLSEIDRRAMAPQLTRIAAEHGPHAADRACSAASVFFGWAVREGLCEVNPTIGLNKHGDTKPRDRVLDNSELAEVWQALGADAYGSICKLLLLTGCRKREIAALRWSEIKGDWIELPPERVKNGRPHQIFLASPALAIIRAQVRRLNHDSVFGGGAAGYTNWGTSKAELDKRILAARRAKDSKAKPMAHFTVHDFRRSFATGASNIGTLPHVVEACLNHQSGSKRGPAGVYNRSVYAAEAREAWLRWGAHVMSIVSGERTTLRA